MAEPDIYPAGPIGVPADLTRPSPAYRRHAYLAVAGVLIFVVAYFALAGWFAWTSYRLLSSLRHAPDKAIILIAGGIAAGFLAVFMLKAVVFVRRGDHDAIQVEITAAEHPRLFRFLHRLADEARAPRPHRVFLSPRVNAAVFYDLSIANLILPSKKNLEIGLGLINVLTLGELKAVLAHELGHFAQRTMAVGRWVYIAQQIAGHIVVKRDGLDRALQWISTIDLRVAWIGWILRLIVWSIRSLVDTLFGWVVLAQRALGREMEFQADLVAVSLTGSDALVHALYRLDAADDALERAIGFASGQESRGTAVADVFAIQTRMLERKRIILDDPAYGCVPALPASPAEHRVFEAQLAHPPRMWATHPPSEVREQNAKRVYVPAALDDRDGWELFENPTALRTQVTARLYAKSEKKLEPVTTEESLREIDEGFDRRYFDPSYRGVYLGRSAMRDAATVDALYAPLDLAPAELAGALEGLYPAALSHDLARLRELSEEKAVLEALRRGILESPGRRVRFRGQDRKRKDLPGMIEGVERELVTARKVITDHDRRARAVHLAAARTLSPAWADYLRALAALVHYADHAEADLEDAAGALRNVLAVVMADQKVTEAETRRVVSAADDLQVALRDIYAQASDVELGPTLAAKLEVPTWKEGMADFEMSPPHVDYLGDWHDAAQSWVSGASRALAALSSAALEELLRAEEQVALAVRSGQPPAADPPTPIPTVPSTYTAMLPGQERPRQVRLGWWDRFQVADGFFAGAARFAVAGVIVGGVVLAGRAISGDATVYVYNGLARPVVVEIDGAQFTVFPRGMHQVEVSPGTLTVRARTTDGALIEQFDASAGDDYGKYAYNIAGSALLYESTFRVGGDAGLPRLQPDRWFEVDVDRVFDQVPPRIQADSDVSSIDVLGRVDAAPGVIINAIDDLKLDPAATTRLIVAHATWESRDAPDLAVWLAAVPGEQTEAIIATRLARDPDDVLTLRIEQDLHGAAACTRQVARAAERPDDASWQYLAARCERDPAARDQRFVALGERFTGEPWVDYATAVAHEYAARWSEAVVDYERAWRGLPAIRSQVLLQLARMRRLASEHASLDDLATESPILEAILATESASTPAEGYVRSYWLLGRGQIDALGDELDKDVALLVLAAASDDAPAELTARALTAAIDDRLDLAALRVALALRSGQDPAPHYARLDTIGGEHGTRAHAFLARVAAGGKDATTAADAGLVDCPATERAALYAAALVILGDASPPAWRDHVRRALFVPERPYFRPPT